MIDTHYDEVSFFVPNEAYADAGKPLVRLAITRGGDPERALTILKDLVRLVESDVYGEFEVEALDMLGRAARSGRSAYSGCRTGPAMSILKRGHRLLRMRSGNMAIQPRSGV